MSGYGDCPHSGILGLPSHHVEIQVSFSTLNPEPFTQLEYETATPVFRKPRFETITPKGLRVESLGLRV